MRMQFDATQIYDPGEPSRVIDDEQKDGSSEDKKKDEANDPKEYFGLKRDLESLCEFMGRWLSSHNRWGSPVFIAGESYGGYRVGRLVRMLQESAGIGLNGAILISPALEISMLASSDYDVLAWVDLLPTMAGAAAHHGRSRAFPRRKIKIRNRQSQRQGSRPTRENSASHSRAK